MSLNMTMKNFLQHMLWRGPDNASQDRQNAATSNDQGNPEMLETGAHLEPDILKKMGQDPRRPSSLTLLANTKKHRHYNHENHCHREPDANEKSIDFNSPTSWTIEEAVKEFGESYKSATKAPSAKKSLSFVKRLVAALERKQQQHQQQRSDGEVRDDFVSGYEDGPIMAYETTGTIRKSKTLKTRKNDVDLSDESLAGKTLPLKTEPKIVGAFLKKPISIDETPVNWIPIIGKKLPRKKSFRKLLARLTGRSDGKQRRKSKMVVFASQDKLVDEIHDSGYEERSISTSSRTSSLASFAETLMNLNKDYVESTSYPDCTFSTFLTSSPVKIEEPAAGDDSQRPRSRLRLVQVPQPEVGETLREDSGYMSSYSISQESSLEKGLVAKRVRQISDQLANLPKHPFARSEPRLHGENFHRDHLSGGIVELRRRGEADEPVYDVPRARPQSSILDESLSMRRRNANVHVVAPLVRDAFPVFYGARDEDEPHYATVRPRSANNRGSWEKPFRSVPEVSEREVIIDKRYSSLNSADLTANSSFVITMYV